MFAAGTRKSQHLDAPMLSGDRAANMCKSSHPISDFVTRLLAGVVSHGVAQGALRCHAALWLDDMGAFSCCDFCGHVHVQQAHKSHSIWTRPCCLGTGLQTCASMDTFIGVSKSWRLKNAWCPSDVAISGGRSG